MRCAVIGGAGFIGSNLCRQLLALGHQVRVLDRAGAKPAVDGCDVAADDWVSGSFTSSDDLARVMQGCEVVFHLASTSLPHTSNDDPLGDMESNIGGALRLMALARELGVRRVVFASSGGTVYGRPVAIPIHEGHPTEPMCAYGISKLAIEKYLALYQELHGLDYAVLRIANPYGPGQSPFSKQGAIAVFLHKALAGETIEVWGDGSVIRDYLHVSDVCAAFARAADHDGPHRVFNVGSGRGYSINEIIETIERVVGRGVAHRYLPGRRFDVPSNVLCIERARAELGWCPDIGLESGLRETVSWQSRFL